MRLWDLDSLERRDHARRRRRLGRRLHPRRQRRCSISAPVWATLPLMDVESGQARTPAYRQPTQRRRALRGHHRDGRFALTGGWQDGTVRMWRLSDGRQVRLFRPEQGSTGARPSPRCRRTCGGPSPWSAARPCCCTCAASTCCTNGPAPRPGRRSCRTGASPFSAAPTGRVWDLSGRRPEGGGEARPAQPRRRGDARHERRRQTGGGAGAR